MTQDELAELIRKKQAEIAPLAEWKTRTPEEIAAYLAGHAAGSDVASTSERARQIWSPRRATRAFA